MKTIVLEKNINCHLHQTTKFNDITISFRFRNNLSNIKRSARAFLTQILSDTCLDLPTKDAVTRYLDTCYGTNFKASGDVIGKLDVIEFRVSTLNGKLVDEDLLDKQLYLLYQFIYRPRLVNGFFDETLFNEMKERLILVINSYHDQPGSHASDQAKRHFNQSQASKALPTIEEIQNTTNQDVVDAYNQLINEDALDIFVLGDFDESVVSNYLTTIFNFKAKNSYTDVLDLNTRDTTNEIIEHKAISQTRMIIMFTTNQTMLDSSYPAMLLANGIFGAFPSSYLFQEIREKRSLCYSISSRLDNYDGLISVSTAIDGNNYETVKSLVLEQLKRIQNGDLSDELFETTRKMYLNVLRSSQDSQKSILTLDYRRILLNDTVEINNVIEAIKHLTKEDCIEAFKNVEPKLFYCLMQEAQHEENE